MNYNEMENTDERQANPSLASELPKTPIRWISRARRNAGNLLAGAGLLALSAQGTYIGYHSSQIEGTSPDKALVDGLAAVTIPGPIVTAALSTPLVLETICGKPNGTENQADCVNAIDSIPGVIVPPDLFNSQRDQTNP